MACIRDWTPCPSIPRSSVWVGWRTFFFKSTSQIEDANVRGDGTVVYMLRGVEFSVGFLRGFVES